MTNETIKKLRLSPEFGFLSQSELAEKLEVSRSTIYLIENKGKMPSMVVAKQIADFFGRTVDEIFFTENVARIERKGGKVQHENQA